MAIRPVIFIGLGSTGAKIVSRIYENIELDRSVAAWIKPFYRYLGINSEARIEEGVNPNLDVFHLTTGALNSRNVIEALLNNRNTSDEFSKQWYFQSSGKPWIPGVDLAEGVGGCRIFGPTLLRYRSFDAANNLKVKLDSLKLAIRDAMAALPHEMQRNVATEKIDCHIFGLLAGGTCSGSLFDIALLAKQAFGANSRIYAEMLLGDVCYEGKTDLQQPHQRRFAQLWNSCFALAELSLVLSSTGAEIVKREWPRHIGNIKLDESVFDGDLFSSVTLVGATNDAERTFNRQGNHFPKYQQFVAEYYSEFLKSAAAAEQEGRGVDDEVQIGMTNDTRSDSRPNRFARIGYVCVCLPREKIVASLEKEVSEHVGLQYFRNADADRVSHGKNTFEHKTQWGLLLDSQLSPFAPPAGLDPMIVADDTCPATAEEFESVWAQTFEQVRDFYTSWMTCHAVEASTAFNAFRDAWRQSLDELAADFCGQSGCPLSLGGLESLLETNLIPLVEERIKHVNTELPKSQRLMSDTSSAFESAFAEVKGDFPGRMNVVRRKFWSGGSMMTDALEAYRDSIRSYSILKLLGEALTILMRELRGMAAVRKLIASYAAGDVFESKRAQEQKVYSVPDSQAVQIEVIKDRGEIYSQLVKPLLEVATGSGTMKEDAARCIASAWAGSNEQGQEGIYAYFQALCEVLRGVEGTIDPQNLAKSARFIQHIQKIKTMLDTKFTAQCDRVFSESLSKLTVWDTIRQYIEQRQSETKMSAEEILTGLFTTYMQYASLFSEMNDTHAGDADEAKIVSNRLCYLCNQDDAVSCFTALGIQNPETYFGRLMSKTSVGKISALDAPGNRDTIQLFQQRTGELPYFYKGFEAVQGLLRNPPAFERGTERYWSDARFPSWIAEWHANKENPPYWVGESTGL